MKIKAKQLVKRFLEIESLKDVGGMDHDLAKECAMAAIEHFNDLHNFKLEKQFNKIDKIIIKKRTVNYSTKELNNG